MIIKRYIVTNMNDAMIKIRNDLGLDAVIVSQRKIRKPGIKGFFTKKVIEVTACTDAIKRKKEEEAAVADSIEAIKKAINTSKEKEKGFRERNEYYHKENKDLKVDSLMKEMQEMKSMISMLSEPKEKATRKTKLEQKLNRIDISEKLKKKILNKITNDKSDKKEDEKLKDIIDKTVNISKTEITGVNVLIGPTGVGKTTTIAKLAGRLSLTDKKKVGLITIDTYRIGAVEQLKTYADIMNLPFKVVINVKEMEEAINSMKDLDVILVDTTGRSSKNNMQISELRTYVEKSRANKVHLVISSTTKNNDIETIVKGYSQIKIDNIIVTKLDETASYGSLLSILDASKKPISYVTTGQNVPDDIMKPTSSEIANLILYMGEDNNDGSS